MVGDALFQMGPKLPLGWSPVRGPLPLLLLPCFGTKYHITTDADGFTLADPWASFYDGKRWLFWKRRGKRPWQHVNFWQAGRGRCVLLRGVCATDLNGNITWYNDINMTASVFSLLLSFSRPFYPSFSLWFPLVPSFLCLPVTNITHKKPLTIEMVLTPTRLHLILRLYSCASGCVRWEWEGAGRRRRRRQPQLIYLFHVAFSPLKTLSGSLFSSCMIVLFSWVFCPSGGSI